KDGIDSDNAASVHSHASSAAASGVEDEPTKKDFIKTTAASKSSGSRAGTEDAPPALSIHALLKNQARLLFKNHQQQATAGAALVAGALQRPPHFQAHFQSNIGKQKSLLVLSSSVSDVTREVPSLVSQPRRSLGVNQMKLPIHQVMPQHPSLCRSTAQCMGHMPSSPQLQQHRSVSLNEWIANALIPLQQQEATTDDMSSIEPISLDLQDLDEMSELSDLDGWETLLEDN
ncbi:MAG: hypothetical protein SGARI_005776, partial [Bacillariaceae sp.]